MRESVRCDEQVQGLDGGTSSPEEEPELSRLLPQVRRLRQLMATVQQGKYPPAVGSRAETAVELGLEGELSPLKCPCRILIWTYQ